MKEKSQNGMGSASLHSAQLLISWADQEQTSVCSSLSLNVLRSRMGHLIWKFPALTSLASAEYHGHPNMFSTAFPPERKTRLPCLLPSPEQKVLHQDKRKAWTYF
jgi:hypothetical protein